MMQPKVRNRLLAADYHHAHENSAPFIESHFLLRQRMQASDEQLWLRALQQQQQLAAPPPPVPTSLQLLLQTSRASHQHKSDFTQDSGGDNRLIAAALMQQLQQNSALPPQRQVRRTTNGLLQRQSPLAELARAIVQELQEQQCSY
jgi:hypothetical protein